MELQEFIVMFLPDYEQKFINKYGTDISEDMLSEMQLYFCRDNFSEAFQNFNQIQQEKREEEDFWYRMMDLYEYGEDGFCDGFTKH